MDYTIISIKGNPANRTVCFINLLVGNHKINLVERFKSVQAMDYGYCLENASFRVRTIDDVLVKNKFGNIKNHFKNEDFHHYFQLARTAEFSRKDEDMKLLIDFVLDKYCENYDIEKGG
ncbi:hypothetical protein J2X97_000361 [Epilithonimonas hungarica]|uniref:hypothetical protein n=1 Tax=Epilithonimonas hungarica TaxID=454006 RepID=UPI002784D800|nr:hypothetical protein [Epilithonimonas hungarica]MDP9954724.1 hypothetical protein [Epilithonimonas hungarica]